MMACAVLTALPAFAAVTVMPVPWDPTNFLSPHTVVSGTVATLTATVNLGGSTDSFTYSWAYGDGSVPASSTPVAVTTGGNSTILGNVYNLSTTHTYTAAPGTTYTAVITVTDVTNPANYTGNYYIVVQANTLQASVNQAIDNGLWFLHTVMDRETTVNADSQVIPWGGWDGGLGAGCLSGYTCLNSGGADATDVQAFEVSGHFENASALDPYTEDVARGLARLMYFMTPYQVASTSTPISGYVNAGPKTIYYNPALMAARCSDGTQPNYLLQTCTTGTYINYNAAATTCTTGSPVAPPATAVPCVFTFDGNSNGQLLVESNDIGDPGYQTGMLVTALVASQNTAGVARTGVPAGVYNSSTISLPGVLGQTYLNIVQDLVDSIGYCQYYGDSDNASGYDNGGGWEYYCAATVDDASFYDDNSPSQWNAIGLIAASRGFGITIPQIVKDTNQVWVTWDECMGSTCTADGYTPGQFGYDAWNDPVWGPWAVTPSGMVQLAMDGVGRTAAGAPDQRWNLAETDYHNNFCNDFGSPYYDPKLYTYGLFSFTKAMEQHDPGGVLTPITLLSDEPSGLSPFNWYSAQNGVDGAPCDGVAQTLVSRQYADGHWYGVDYTGNQYYFETAWSINMLQKTSFVECITDADGAGKAGTRSGGPMVTLTWSPYAGATNGYTVERSTVNGGPYTKVGKTNNPAFTDQTAGLTNGGTFYYVVQPDNGNGAVCNSNQVTITIP
jgi:hypothetical protein